MANKTSITGYIGTLFTKTSAPNTSMDEVGASLAQGQVYVDNRSSQTDAAGDHGGSLMIYNSTKAAWYGVLLTTSTSTTTTTTTTTTTSTTTSTSAT